MYILICNIVHYHLCTELHADIMHDVLKYKHSYYNMHYIAAPNSGSAVVQK